MIKVLFEECRMYLKKSLYNFERSNILTFNMFAETGWKSNKKTKPKIFDRFFCPKSETREKSGNHEHYYGNIGI